MIEQSPNTESYASLVRRLAKPGAAIITSLSARTAHILHMAIGIAGEANEVELGIADLLVTCDDGGTVEDMHALRQAVIKEMGDLEFYVQGMIDAYPLLADPYMKAENDVKTSVIDYDKLSTQHEQLLECTVLVRLTSLSILEDVKKMAIYNKPIDDTTSIMQPLFGLRSALLNIYKILGTNRAEVQQVNIDKLLRRYPNGYSNEAAIARVDMQEAPHGPTH